MPQMAPISWLFLFFFFLFIISLFSLLIFFIPNFKSVLNQRQSVFFNVQTKSVIWKW